MGSKSCFGSDPRVRHMTVDSRVSRVCSVLSLLLLRLVAIVIASALILEVLRLLLETLVSQKFDRNTEYLVWTSVAIGALAVQKLQELLNRVGEKQKGGRMKLGSFTKLAHCEAPLHRCLKP